MKSCFIRIFVLTLTITILFISNIYACTKFVYEGKNIVLTGRSTDWTNSIKTNIWLFPRGIERNGLAGPNSVNWTSKYGSVVSTVDDMMTIDGINEKGLTMSILRLKESKFISKNNNKNRKALGIALWGQYFLDNFRTVKEAVNFMKKDKIYVVPFNLPKGQSSGMHVAISDANGDFAIFEYIDGKLNIYNDKNYKIVTNSPKYSDQIAIGNYWKNFNGEFLPGTGSSSDRFSRGYYYLNKLPKTNNLELAKSYVLSLLRNVSSPLGIQKDNNQEDSATLWKTISDNKNKTYYFESSYKNYGFFINLKKLNFDKKESVKYIDLIGGKYYFGDATNKFTNKKPFEFFPSYGITLNK